MHMRNVQALILMVLLSGCTSRIAMLQTDRPELREYTFIFGRMLLDYKNANTLPSEMRIANYENQLNIVLQNDPNTNSCSIVPDTINFGEPGSQGAARVRCENVVNFQIQEGIYTREGNSVYAYILP